MHSSDINQWTRKLTEAHKNPIKKLELTGTKLFLPSKTDQEKELVQNSLQILSNALQSERVERRCARALANWLPAQKLAEVTKSTGISNNYGFANKNGKFLYPEEAMFLLETNRLELLWNKVPMSIQQAYMVVLNDLTKYLAYRKLVLEGFRLMRTKEVGEPAPKKLRINETTRLESSEFNDIFKKLQENGPKKFVCRTKDDCDYKIFSPENCCRLLPDFNLDICRSKCVDASIGLLEETTPNVVCCTDSQFVGYLRFASVDLPHL